MPPLPEGLLEGFDRAPVVHGSASAVISISAPAPAPVSTGSTATAVGTATGRPRPDCRLSTRTVTPQEGPHRQ
ncbi:hypothetical protein [Corynebacterium variabile]|uniref:hypothetical protein n=1 Tax=Corynebacterium variabile TaxID=1727 RepID=UPI0028AB738A|nr:hypothetical protein [Corynebacterium variabile]